MAVDRGEQEPMGVGSDPIAAAAHCRNAPILKSSPFFIGKW